MKNNRSIYVVSIFMLVTMVSIGYAILTGQLNINGTAKVKAASWDIYFANIKIKDGSVVASVKPSITDKTTVNFEVELKKPGDFYEFNVDVVNDGMIDAMIESVSITPELTIDQQKYLSYSVTYKDGTLLEVKDILHAQKSRTLKVRVEYLKSVDNGELNQNDETINIKATIKYVQADSTAKEPLSEENEIFRLFSIVSGDGTQVGDEIAIGDEHFYVISNDGTNITMLAKYNLLVGYNCDMSRNNCVLISNPTGIQSETTNKQPSGKQIGTVAFSETYYWAYETYVYNNQASISQYVNNYKDYLEELGATIKEARLINRSELLIVGCDEYNSCSAAPNWVKTSQYWTGINGRPDGIISVIGDRITGYSNSAYNYAGVRPVIVIPADSI